MAAASPPYLLFSLDGKAKPLKSVPKNNGATILIGPEGDFTDEEMECAITRGAHIVSLGRYTYRSEVAAMLAVALVQYELGELGP